MSLAIVISMFLMFALTIMVGIVAFWARVKSVRSGKLSLDYFTFMSGQSVPDSVVASTRNLNNQFEVPVLFYTAGVLSIVLGIESLALTVSAGFFVFFRYIHAFVHLTYNKLLHRMLAFWLAIICVSIMWIMILIHVVAL